MFQLQKRQKYAIYYICTFFFFCVAIVLFYVFVCHHRWIKDYQKKEINLRATAATAV